MSGKLVRDKIPEIIAKDTGKSVNVKILSDEEYKYALYRKLDEEVKEFYQSGDVEELVDIVEVVLALVELQGVNHFQFQEMEHRKLMTNGGFSRRFFLVEEETDD